MDITLTKEESYLQIVYTENYFILDFIYNPKIYALLHTFPEASKGGIVPNRWTVMESGFSHFNKLQEFISWKSKEELERDKANLSNTEENLSDVLSRVPQHIDTSFMKIEPYQFQKLAVGWALTPKGLRANTLGGILADLMGLGKTIQGIAISLKYKREYNAKKCLIVCPAALRYQWSTEIEKFTDEDYMIIEGTKKQREKKFSIVQQFAPYFSIINYELISTRNKSSKTFNPLDFEVLQQIIAQGYDMIILDEAHRIKNPDALISQAMRHIQPKFKLLMTGTPITKDTQNIFNLVDYLHPNILADQNLTFNERRKQFEDRFIIMSYNQFAKWEKTKIPTGSKNTDLLKQIVSPYMLRRTTEEVSDELPKQIEKNFFFDWDTEQKRIYDTFSKKLLAVRSEKEKAKTPFESERFDNELHAIYMYLQEVCNSPELLLMSNSKLLKNHLKLKEKIKNPPKLIQALDMIEEILSNGTDKIIIFTKFERMTQIFKREIDQISINFDKTNYPSFNSVLYTGKTPDGCEHKKQLISQNLPSRNLNCLECPLIENCNTRTKAQYLFQNDPHTKVIIATDAANYGVNLHSGKYLFNYDLPDSYSVYDQRKGRNKRIGSKHKEVFVYNFGIKGAIDSKKYDKLMAQKEIIDLVVEKSIEEEYSVHEKTAEMQMVNDFLNEKDL